MFFQCIEQIFVLACRHCIREKNVDSLRKRHSSPALYALRSVEKNTPYSHYSIFAHKCIYIYPQDTICQVQIASKDNPYRDNRSSNQESILGLSLIVFKVTALRGTIEHLQVIRQMPQNKHSTHKNVLLNKAPYIQYFQGKAQNKNSHHIPYFILIIAYFTCHVYKDTIMIWYL